MTNDARSAFPARTRYDRSMSMAPHFALCAAMAIAMTVDLDATRRATASRPMSSDFSIDEPAPAMAFACRGPIAGIWMLTDVAVESVVSGPPRCPGRRVDTLVGSGTLVLDPDGTFADTTTLDVQVETVFIPNGSRAPTCGLLERQIAWHERLRSVSCVDGVAGDCACTETIVPSFSRCRFTGKYSVGAEPKLSVPWCAGPNVMKLRSSFEDGTYVLTLAKLES